MKYYKITKDDALALGVTEFRRGGEKGYIVNEGDLAVSPEIASRAKELSRLEAHGFIKDNNYV